MKPIHIAGVIVLTALMYPLLALSQQNILLYYNERPPYLITGADGSVSGLTGTPASMAFEAAGIPFTWIKMPSNRQLLYIRKGAGLECAVGWFKNQERERYAKFTKAIYRDLPTVAVGNMKFPYNQEMRLEQVLAIEGVRVLVKDEYSYGPFIDRLLATLHPNIVSTSNENLAMVKMIQLNRADFMFVAEEEAKYLLDEIGADHRNLRIMRFPDMPLGEKRYIMCSRKVPDEIIDRLNRVITFE